MSFGFEWSQLNRKRSVCDMFVSACGACVCMCAVRVILMIVHVSLFMCCACVCECRRGGVHVGTCLNGVDLRFQTKINCAADELDSVFLSGKSLSNVVFIFKSYLKFIGEVCEDYLNRCFWNRFSLFSYFSSLVFPNFYKFFLLSFSNFYLNLFSFFLLPEFAYSFKHYSNRCRSG